MHSTTTLIFWMTQGGLKVQLIVEFYDWYIAQIQALPKYRNKTSNIKTVQKAKKLTTTTMITTKITTTKKMQNGYMF